MCIKVIASQRWDVFLRHGVVYDCREHELEYTISLTTAVARIWREGHKSSKTTRRFLLHVKWREITHWTSVRVAATELPQLLSQNMFGETTAQSCSLDVRLCAALKLTEQEAQLSLRDRATRACQLKSGKVLHKCRRLVFEKLWN